MASSGEAKMSYWIFFETNQSWDIDQWISCKPPEAEFIQLLEVHDYVRRNTPMHIFQGCIVLTMPKSKDFVENIILFGGEVHNMRVDTRVLDESGLPTKKLSEPIGYKRTKTTRVINGVMASLD